MVLAYHLIFTAYGFWLPNDPRGSWSDTIRAWELLRFGPATRVTTRASVADVPHSQAMRQAAKAALRYPPVAFTPDQRYTIADGFREAIRRSSYRLLACAIMPEHVHLVVARHRYMAEKMLNQLKGEASKALGRAGNHPFQDVILPGGKRHSPWTQDGWKVFLDSPENVQRAVAYVVLNPEKEGRRRQSWDFVVRYSTW